MTKPTGELSLRFRRRKDGQTYVAEQYYKLPLQVMRTHYQEQDGTAFVYLLNPSGGVLQHDRLLTEIILEENSKAYITTPSSTKFYKMDDGHAEVVNRITLGSGAVLEYFPEHNAPFAMSEAYQDNEYHLKSDSILLTSDMVTAGRATRGEVFAYRLYSSRTRIYVDGKLRVYDNSRMDARNTDMEKIGYMEGYLTNGTVYVYSSGLSDELPMEINEIQHEGNVVFAAGKIDDDFMIIRFLGDNMVDLRSMMDVIWGRIRKHVLGKDAIRIRKY